MDVVVERMFPHDFALESAYGFVCSMHDSVRKQSAESCGYVVFVGVGVGEGDRLVG